MAIGRPLNLTANVASKVISATATASQKQFTVTGGYRINELAVYRNGIRLVNGQDYTATDGLTVTLTQAATLSDIFEFQVFDSFNIADAIDSNSASQTIGGDLTVSGTLTATATTASGLSGSVTSSGPLTISDATASTSTSTGALIVTGGVGIGKSLFVSEGISVGGTITYDDVTNVDSIGIVTAGKGFRATTGGIIVTAGVSTFGAQVSIADSIVHTGDTNTAIRFPSADTFTVESGGVQRIRVGAAHSNAIGLGHYAAANSGPFVQISRGPNYDKSSLNPSTCFLHLGGEDVSSTTGYYGIGFGYIYGNPATTAPAYIAYLGTEDNGYTHGDLTFWTKDAGAANVNAIERLRIKAGGNVGIGTTSPGVPLHVYHATTDGVGRFESGDANALIGFRDNSTTNTVSLGSEADDFKLLTGGVERMRIDSSGRLLVGATSDVAPDSFGSLLQVDSSDAGGSIALGRHTASGSGPFFLFHKSRSGGAAGNTVVQDGDTLGGFRFFGADGTDRNSYGASIACEVDGTPGSNDMPGRLVFSTTADGASTPTERMRITSSGRIQITGSRAGALQASDNDSLELYTKATGGGVDTGCALTFYNHDSSGFEMGGTIGVAKENATADNTSSYMMFATRANGSSATEQFRINSSGALRSGGSSNSAPAHSFYYETTDIGALCANNGDTTSAGAPAASFATGYNSTTTSNNIIKFFVNNFATGSGAITANGTSQAAFGSYSDERLKENIIDLPSQLENIKNLRPVEFDYIAGGHQIGFIAQEFENVYPEAVGSVASEENPDEERLTITGWSKTEAYLVKALQEAIAKIETLETKVAALEAA